ncbi:hypothetical protein ACFE04_010701 [Oxalis oulophora]
MPGIVNYNSAASVKMDTSEIFKHWKSPEPYLFCGLVSILILTSLALIILSCSDKKPSPTSTTNKQFAVEIQEKTEVEEPNFVVIMAGDSNPTYMAMPIACTCNVHPQQQV